MDSRRAAEGAPETSALSRRFESWKEIAGYFGRDVRTVRRWERSEGLPVHRHLHSARGSVYAFQDELDRWLASRRMSAEGQLSAPADSPGPGSKRRVAPGMLVLLVGISAVISLASYAFVVKSRTSVASTVDEPRRIPPGDVRSIGAVADPRIRERFFVAKHQLQRAAGHRQQAREHLEAVVALAPDVAEAHALLGEVYLREALFNAPARAASWQKAEACVRRALAIDSNDATAHAVLSRILLLRDWNWTDALAEVQRALELDPDAADVRSAYALYLRSAGRSGEAIVERERARRADLLNPQRLIALGDEYAFARRYADAIEAYQRALEIERDHRAAVASLADVYPRLGRHAEGAFWQSRMLTLAGRTELAAAFDDVRRRQGPKQALEWLDRHNVAEFERAPDDHLWDLAYVHARLGHHEAALEFLRRACERRQPGMLQARVDPDLDSLRGDRRFVDLLKRVGPP